MTEDEKSPSQKLRESTAEGCVCPDCGHDVQPEEIRVERAHNIGEIYFQPACVECGIYNNTHDTDHWYPEGR